MRLFLFFFLLVNNIVWGQMRFRTYSDSALGFSINYPQTWEHMKNPRTAFVFVRPVEQQGQLFRENVNLVLSPSNGYSLDEYFQVSKQRMSQYLQGYKEISSSKSIINGNQYANVVYTHVSNGVPTLKVSCYMMIKDRKGYTFTFSALESSYPSFYPIFLEILESFRFLK